ncbi:MAG: ribonuclease H-like YkuK family protein [Flavobacteriales bacterium]|nr:ribonuclease H-like YkuK family protein [Flavobacteriales bacterium]MDG1781202.1 ribonuclease H-like YkuK family protein [Flavobacteriales bacterium]MDG2245833.1 ribonuclease H-like YkuK family protein [Flavobacteriales bacterium]
MVKGSRTFQIMGGEKRFDFAQYINSFWKTYPHCELHIGCDSQNFKTYTVYVTTIVFRFPEAGAHVIYRKERVPKILDMWTKLWGETERSVALADAIRSECGIKVKQIDLDFNTNPAFPSNKLLSASAGYANSMGFNCKAKPNLLMAVWAANALCQ